ncbi:MAG: hypothetical protein KGZ25_06730 [Planctomycetes bacterium]|nr:hypothetical protein [Planctomycetota bacterium]
MLDVSSGEVMPFAPDEGRWLERLAEEGRLAVVIYLQEHKLDWEHYDLDAEDADKSFRFILLIEWDMDGKREN